MTALEHPARRQILLTVHLRGGTMTAGEIAGRFAHAWATTTGHLRVLENAHLLNHQKMGRVRQYTINEEQLGVVEEWLSWFKAKAITAASLDSEGNIVPLDAAPKKI